MCPNAPATIYLGHEAPSLNGLIFFLCVCVCGDHIIFGVDVWSSWLVGVPPICHQCHLAKNEMWASEVCFVACPTWLYGLFVRILKSCTNTCAGCSRPTLNWPTLSVLTWVTLFWQRSHFTSCHRALAATPFVQIYVELFSMNVNLKMFCILCLCILFYATQVKCQKIWLLFWNKVSFCRVFLLSSLSVVRVPWRLKTLQNKLHEIYFKIVMCPRK